MDRTLSLVVLTWFILSIRTHTLYCTMLKRSKVVWQRAKAVSQYIPPSERAIQEHEKFKREKRRKERLSKILHYGFFTLAGGAALMYLWQPWNPYSPEVSKDLRKGLWEERTGKDDYLEALKHYQDALRTSKEENMEQLSMKYTGIVLKIAEMYEKLDMTDKLLLTYYNLSTFIFENMIHGNVGKDNPERGLLIDRDLVVITRWAMLKQQLKQENWADDINTEIRDRIAYIENNEIKNDLPWVLAVKSTEHIDVLELIDVWSKTQKFELTNSNKEKWIDRVMETEEGKEFLKCWDILRDVKDMSWPVWLTSYLKMRDFYAMFQLGQSNFPITIQLLQSNLLWSTIAGFNESVSLTTQIINLASAWFQYAQASNNAKAYKKSELIYEKLIASVNSNDPILPMSYYSLGVLNLQLGKKEEATRYFTKSRELAVEMDQIQIIDKIDDEQLKQLKVRSV